MIIQCINCNKKFEVSSTLIPLKGRNIQCGSCNHTWFYKSNTEITLEDLPEINKEEKTNDKDEDYHNNEIIINDTPEKITKFSDNALITKPSNFNIGKVLSYFLVCIITFIALILILDTFQTFLSTKLPSLELILYNLFETIEDISLFLKNLFF